MRILAIDPGPVRSAAVLFDSRGFVMSADTQSNGSILLQIKSSPADTLAVEMIASYGMPVGREVFETCVWIGRFLQAWSGPSDRVYRKDVKMYLCGNMRAKDTNIRQALIDKFGGKENAIGLKKTPGPLYHVKADEWAALAVAVTYAETVVSPRGPIIAGDIVIPF